MLSGPDWTRPLFGLPLIVLCVACGGGSAPGRDGAGGRATAGRPGGDEAPAAIPVEVTAVERRSISSFLETNGVLEAENEVDVVARVAGPVVELLVEENDAVRRGQVLARIDAAPIRAQLEISQVDVQEAEQAFARAQALRDANLVSQEAFDQAQARRDAARAQVAEQRVQLEHTVVSAPFEGLIVRRYVKFAESVAVNQALFRLSDFTPLLCPIQVPERELQRLHAGQRARIEVEAYPDRRFDGRVDRVSPVVDAATGTVRVTLEVDGDGVLRPGMFASVYLETATREDALVMPRSALALDSLGDTVFVLDEGKAERRDVELGFREGALVEVLSGVEEGERVVTVGQDGLTDGTPVQVLGAASGDD
ncbi:MAG: efflux RND transporter periplasmic adaptor subunit [Thermoanaerobaculia bacterium]